MQYIQKINTFILLNKTIIKDKKKKKKKKKNKIKKKKKFKKTKKKKKKRINCNYSNPFLSYFLRISFIIKNT